MKIPIIRSLAGAGHRTSAWGRMAMLATIVLAGLAGLIASTATPASALPCRYPYCDPDPWPPSPPPPPPPTYLSDSRPLAVHPGQVQPVVKYGAEHVATTVKIRYLIQRSTGQPIQAWLVSSYHIWNDYAFQGWNVTVSENVYSTAQPVASTNQHTYGVTGTFWDPSGSNIWTPDVLSPIPVQTAQSLYDFQAVDTFSN